MIPRDDEDDFPDERAHDAAVRRHKRAQAWEDANTGGQLDPLPAFGAVQDDDEGDEP